MYGINLFFPKSQFPPKSPWFFSVLFRKLYFPVYNQFLQVHLHVFCVVPHGTVSGHACHGEGFFKFVEYKLDFLPLSFSPFSAATEKGPTTALSGSLRQCDQGNYMCLSHGLFSTHYNGTLLKMPQLWHKNSTK